MSSAQISLRKAAPLALFALLGVLVGCGGDNAATTPTIEPKLSKQGVVSPAAVVQPKAVQPVPNAPESIQRKSSTATPVHYAVTAVVTQWKPAVLVVEPGARIVFKQMAGHDTETIAGLFPVGAAPWKSKLGEEGFSVELTIPGAYVYKCNPHASSGMVAAIVVGSADNLAALESHPDNKGMVGRAIRILKQEVAKTTKSVE